MHNKIVWQGQSKEKGIVKLSEVKATINAEWVSNEVASIIYRQEKAKIFNLLESQISPETPPGQNVRLQACKRIAEDNIGNTANIVAKFLRRILGDWEQCVEAGGEVSIEAKNEHE